ncbi:hypothetical protein HanRHA438_Chr10g0465991 [Helianthus annuus]|nr:hypothetical protein HanPI659440_Chr10g0389281 [Helianthus annuus]KAJ0880683.1 hypothetical protein HanRHA438_Chr10g0465991 [Helianthus annuus]
MLNRRCGRLVWYSRWTRLLEAVEGGGRRRREMKRREPMARVPAVMKSNDEEDDTGIGT